jgi:hypothetical protein
MTDRTDGVDHVHPDADEALAAAHRRGPERRPVTDGAGDPDPERRSDEGDADPEATVRMRDVSHTPPHGDGTNEVWSRGDEDDDE